MNLADVENLAQLAKIPLGSSEKEKMKEELGFILKYVEEIKGAELPKLKEAGPPGLVLKNVMREDVSPHSTGEYTDVLSSAFPEEKNGFVKVPKVL